MFLCGNVFYFSTKISLRLGFGDTVYKKVLIFYQKVYSFPPSLLLQLLLILTKPSPSLIFLILTLFRNHQISFCLYNDMFDNKNCSHLFQGNIPKRKKVFPQNNRIKLFQWISYIANLSLNLKFSWSWTCINLDYSSTNHPTNHTGYSLGGGALFLGA